MRVKITYCHGCGGKTLAQAVAKDVQSSTGEECELVAKSGGVFDVEVDGKIVFSRENERRYPMIGEAVALVVKAL